MKHILFIIPVLLISYILKAEITLKAETPEDKDLGCITLLKLASEKSKNAGEMIKYEKLKKLQKSFQEKYNLSNFDNNLYKVSSNLVGTFHILEIARKYKLNHFSEKATQLKFDEHNLKIKEKGQRYVNKNLQRCGLK